ncbi:kunitz/BPTI-like toxin isoform X1 [Glossina fuscipes]|uniref:Kunitz/BPTI-like toxin isoform X1 n=1 Tax=Glossina fuscipes TaxID=7396 RepID=A0A8U0WL52_9MUSC|nr:kunitz/BPTI-like toxin isoform X1 [Glossina fuscipes]
MTKTLSILLMYGIVGSFLWLLFAPSVDGKISAASSIITAATAAAADCKELSIISYYSLYANLDQWNCYSARNEGYFCNSKDQTTTQLRWYYDKGQCKKFNYKGCYGNRNRFCTKEICMKRCEGQ